MTREEAINVLNDYDINFERNTAEEVAEAHEMAIKALEQQPNEDCISRDATLTAFSDYVGGGMSMNDFDAMWDIVVKMPPVEPKPKTSEDCISRKAVLDSLHSYFADGFDGDKWWNSTVVLYAINKTPSVTPQPETEGARGNIPLQQSVPKMPQSSERTEERTETHECDCISRKEAIDALKQQAENMLCWSERYTEQRKGILIAINIVSDLLSVTPQSKEEPQQKTGHWIGHREHCEKLGVIPSGLGVYEWCSNCGHGIDIRDWSRISHSYCPECGAKMQEVQE